MWTVTITGGKRPVRLSFPSFLEALKEQELWRGTGFFASIQWVEPLCHVSR